MKVSLEKAGPRARGGCSNSLGHFPSASTYVSKGTQNDSPRQQNKTPDPLFINFSHI